MKELKKQEIFSLMGETAGREGTYGGESERCGYNTREIPGNWNASRKN